MAYVNGEWVEQDDPNKDQNPMAGLASTSTPSRQGGTQQESLYDAPDWQSKVNTMGLNPNWDTLKTAGQANNISPEDWSKGFQYYNDNITPFAGNSEWWGQDAMTRAGMQGYAGANPTANFNWSQYTNPQQETMQQKQKADEGMARQAKNGGDGGLGGLGMVGLLAALAATVFSGGAAAPLLAGEVGAGAAGLGALEGASALSTVGSFGAGAGGLGAVEGASALGGLGSFSAGAGGGGASLFGAGAAGAAAGSSAGDWAGDFGGAGDFTPQLPTGNTLADLPSYGYGGGSDPGLFDMFNQGGIDFEGAGNFMGNPGASATNLEQTLNISPQAQGPNVDLTSAMQAPDTVGPIDPSAPSQGLDTSGWTSGQDLPGGADFSTKDRLLNSLKGIKNMTNSPYFQVPKTLYNLYSQNQKVNQLQSMMSKFQQQSDVGGPFRDLMMKSYSDPNFFKGMPEFGAGMDAFNQQYGANAAKNGQRSQLGGAAHNIAVNRESARLADIYRGRLGQMAGQPTNMQGMAALAPALANAQGNQMNSLFDPQLWNSLKDLF